MNSCYTLTKQEYVTNRVIFYSKPSLAGKLLSANHMNTICQATFENYHIVLIRDPFRNISHGLILCLSWDAYMNNLIRFCQVTVPLNKPTLIDPEMDHIDQKKLHILTCNPLCPIRCPIKTVLPCQCHLSWQVCNYILVLYKGVTISCGSYE